MKRTDHDHEFTGASLLCLELERAVTSGSVRVTLSIPGRAGASTRTWLSLGTHGLTEGQVLDVEAHITTTVRDWLLLWGAQRELPL